MDNLSGKGNWVVKDTITTKEPVTETVANVKVNPNIDIVDLTNQLLAIEGSLNTHYEYKAVPNIGNAIISLKMAIQEMKKGAL